jgi:hypothetical protein
MNDFNGIYSSKIHLDVFNYIAREKKISINFDDIDKIAKAFINYFLNEKSQIDNFKFLREKYLKIFKIPEDDKNTHLYRI